jgi:hypothetical protein
MKNAPNKTSFYFAPYLCKEGVMSYWASLLTLLILCGCSSSEQSGKTKEKLAVHSICVFDSTIQKSV